MYFVYVLISTTDRELYVGSTNDLKRRFKEHTNGKVTSTHYRRPLKLIYYEAYLLWSDAKRRETFFKGGKGKAELKIQLQDALRKIKYKHI